jgi:hypothetical protein
MNWFTKYFRNDTPMDANMSAPNWRDHLNQRQKVWAADKRGLPLTRVILELEQRIFDLEQKGNKE